MRKHFSLDIYRHDLAIIRLESLSSGKFVTFNSAAQAICLPQPSQEYKAGMRCTITGWGSQNAQTNGKKTLGEVDTLVHRLS